MEKMQNIADKCPVDEIAAYIDGELDLEQEFALDAHFAVCRSCSFELNQQKQFLCGLSSSLKHEGEIELPANFAKLIVANAESTVSGVRQPSELYNAAFICAGLGLFVLFALGGDVRTTITGIYGVLDQGAVVAGFIGHIIFSVVLGIVIVMRSIATEFRVDVAMVILAASTLAASAMFVSRKILGIRRA